MRKLITIFAIPELRRKILITLLFLVIYRIGYSIPLPMVDQVKLAKKVAEQQSGAMGQVLGLVSTFSGGNLSNATIFALGIMPYISASIILQLLAASGLSPYLERLRKEPNGQKKINEYTRYLTIPITLIQAIFWIRGLIVPEPNGWGIMAPGYANGFNYYWFGFAAILTVTVGTMFMMWLGEQIDEYGIGNGISLIIMAGIIGRIPDATRTLLFDSVTGNLKSSLFTLGAGTGDISFEKLLLMVTLFIAVVVAVIAITKGQRRIPTQSAKHVRGRRVYGGTRQFLPLKVNQAGVMPVIFASSLLIIPGFLFNLIHSSFGAEWAGDLGASLQRGSGWLYNVLYIALIYFFCYFWTAITFNPKDMANNLKDYGSFIPGYRPGKSTADYLEKVLMRITYVGAAFLAVIAIIPTIVTSELQIDPRIATFYGGTSLLIVVSVCLDLVQKINSHLVMRNYPGLTEDEAGVFRREIQKPVQLKSVHEIALMREAGKLVAHALRMCREMAKPGARTADINQAVEDYYAAHNATPLFKDYLPAGMTAAPFPAVTCLSLNDQVVHGIPSNRALRDGDLLKVDTACRLNGWCADAAITIPIGVVRAERLRLIRVAEEVLQVAALEMGRRRWWSEVAVRMQRHVQEAGFAVVEQYVGHGIGRDMHESPQVPNFVNREMQKRGDFRLETGLVLAVEPMVNMSRGDVRTLEDQWTVVTQDGLPSVHVEHTFAITPTGVVNITADAGDPAGVVRLPEMAAAG